MSTFVAVFKAEMLNFLGLNVYRHTKDPSERKRRKILYIVFFILFLVAVAYLAGSAYAFHLYGIERVIPMLYPCLAMVISLFVEILLSRGNLYRAGDRELLSSMPVKSTPVAAARLAKMYIRGVIISAVVLIPTFLIYGLAVHAGVLFWIMIVPEILVLPLLPVALAAWVGIAVSALIARTRHKVLVEVLVAVIVVVGMLALSMYFSGGRGVSVNLTGLTQSEDGGKLSRKEMNDRVAEQAVAAIERIETKMPFVKTWASFFNGEKPVGILLIAALGLAVFALTALVIGRNLFVISAKLTPQALHRDYKLTELRSRSVTEALVRKEAGRYFSSGLYVSNTIIGPVIAVAISIALAFVDIEKLLGSNVKLPFAMHPTSFLPFLLAAVFSMMTLTAVSISAEGKTWWITKTLPVSVGDIINAKILFNILVFAPFYVLSEIILLFTVRTTVLQRLWILIVPLVYLVFATVWGMCTNLRFPKFRWETEAEVVKQSASVALGMLALVFAILPGVGALMLPELFGNLLTAATVVAVVVAAVLLYRRIQSADLLRLGA
ncbi:MAG: hypothetical protein J5645_01745 [Lachnospiraceae bacterium]|nr:hypothetical protein [Lachnospiraceae bacterium]